jgi:hypothetical protein
MLTAARDEDQRDRKPDRNDRQRLQQIDRQDTTAA